MSTEERIRRAEERYYKRKEQGEMYSISRQNTGKIEKHDFSLYKRMILQICICFIIYFIFYLVQNTEYFFSQELLQKVNHFLSYDMNLQSVYVQTINWIEEGNKKLKGIIAPKQEEVVDENKEETQNTENIENQDNQENVVTEGESQDAAVRWSRSRKCK